MLINTTLHNRYKILEEISADSLNIIYKAQDEAENKPVLINILTEKALSRPLEVLLRFKKAAETAAKLSHPNLLKTFCVEESDNYSYVVQEYVDAQPLAKFLNQPWDMDKAVELILQIALALNTAHEQNLLHQAIQPQNILISQGQLTVAKLYNFGVSILRDISRITEPKEVISTFGYLSPESSGILRKSIDSRSDIYSLGILFYQLLAGKLPYLAQDVSSLIHQHIATKPDSPSKYNPQIHPVLDNIILRLIAKEPAERYQSLSGLVADLAEYQKQKREGKALIDFEIARSDRLAQLSFSTRLIGRDSELNQLKSLLDQTKQGQGSLCFVFGEPGIGKSRLIDELRGHVHTLGGIFAGGKCYQYEFRTPYKVFAEAIDAYIEKVKRLSQKEQETNIKRIKETIGELGGEVIKIAPTIIDLIGQPPKLVELEPEKEKIRFLITVTNFLASLASPESPLLMFLDDLQWVDDGSLEILERFADKLSNVPVNLIISYRDTEVGQNHPLAQLIKRLTEQNIKFFNIPVKSFSLSETAQMICQILITKEERILPLAQELQGRAKGNPFFTLELLHSLVDSGVVFLKESNYAYDLEKLKTTSLPTSIVDAVLKRMNDLNEEELQIISYASIMGKEVEFNLLTELAKKPTDKIINSIEDGINSQLLFRDLTGRENIYFMHDRIREAFYKRVNEEERIPLHRHIAEVLEQQNKDNPESVLYDLAHHFINGKVEDKALQYALPAAHKAKSSYANTLAVSLYNTAREILEKQNNTHNTEYIDVMENLGEVYRLSGKFDESVQTLKACESFIPQEDKLHRAQVFAKMGDTYFEKGDIDNSAPVLEQALAILGANIPRHKIFVFMSVPIEFTIHIFHMLFPGIFVRKVFREDQKTLIITRLLYRLGYVYYFSDAIKMYYVCARGLNLAESKLGPCRELAQLYAIGVPSHSTTLLPWPWRAMRDGKIALKMAQQIQDKIMEGVAYSYLCLIHYLVNKPVEGVEHGNKGIKILKGLGEYWIMSMAYAFRDDHNNFIIGKFQDSQKGVKEFLAITREVKSLQNLGWAMFIQARVSYLLGDIDLAIESAKESIHWLQVSQDKMNEEFATAILAFAYLKKGEYDKAIEEIEKAMVLFWRYATGGWAVDIFHKGAEIYFGKILNTPNLSRKDIKAYLRHALWFCMMARLWSLIFIPFRGWSYQIRGTYLWLNGRKRTAKRAWEKGLHWLRTNKNNPGGDKYRIAYILLEEAKFLLQDNPKDKKAYANLIEARDFFAEMGCKLDLDTCNRLLESLSPDGITIDSRQVLTQKRHLESLLSVTQAIGSIFVLDELLDRILEYGLKVTGAERGFLLLYDEKDKTLKLKVSHGLEQDLANLPFSYDNYKISLELISEVQNSKTATISDHENALNAKIQNELKNFQVRQAIAVPLRTREKPLGVLYMDNRLAGGMFGKDELELMKSFAVQASVSIENAYLVASLVEQERLKQELELGRQIQTALLPKESPVILGLKVSGFMLPAKEIGGDYYDFVELPSNNLAIVIGDVSGKGVAAGLLMSMAKTAVHTLSQEETSPRNVLLRTNQILVKHIGSQKFMTMLYFKYDTSNRALTYSSAGHEHILIYRGGGRVESIISGGFMLGMIPDIASFLEDKTITLNKGDKIILYTDGVTEARNPQEDLFSLERLIQVVNKYGSKPASELMNSIKEEVYGFIGTREQYDDVTLVVMEAE